MTRPLPTEPRARWLSFLSDMPPDMPYPIRTLEHNCDPISDTDRAWVLFMCGCEEVTITGTPCVVLPGGSPHA